MKWSKDRRASTRLAISLSARFGLAEPVGDGRSGEPGDGGLVEPAEVGARGGGLEAADVGRGWSGVGGCGWAPERRWCAACRAEAAVRHGSLQKWASAQSR